MDEILLHELLGEMDLNKNGQLEFTEFLQVSFHEDEHNPKQYAVKFDVKRHGVIQKILAVDGGLHLYYTKFFNTDSYAKSCLWVTQGQNRRFKKKSYCICSQKCGLHIKHLINF